MVNLVLFLCYYYYTACLYMLLCMKHANDADGTLIEKASPPPVIIKRRRTDRHLVHFSYDQFRKRERMQHTKKSSSFHEPSQVKGEQNSATVSQTVLE